MPLFHFTCNLGMVCKQDNKKIILFCVLYLFICKERRHISLGHTIFKNWPSKNPKFKNNISLALVFISVQKKDNQNSMVNYHFQMRFTRCIFVIITDKTESIGTQYNGNICL